MGRTLAALLTAFALSCSRPPPDATPEGALREWLDLMSAGDDAPRAYALLSKGTHQLLEKRAERSSRIEGHRVDPADVIAKGRFAMRFEPRQFKTTIAGDTATVDVVGDGPSDQATLHCVKEGSAWRVVLDLPDIQELPHRVEH